MKIDEYINKKLHTGQYKHQYELARELGIKPALLSHYRSQYTKQPPLELAKLVYKNDETIIWPYSKEAVSEN